MRYDYQSSDSVRCTTFHSLSKDDCMSNVLHCSSQLLLLFSPASGAGNHQGVLLLFSSAKPVYATLDRQPPLEHERKAHGPSAKKT
jgi:hypothetical protein